jgi:hypothetical protein
MPCALAGTLYMTASQLGLREEVEGKAAGSIQANTRANHASPRICYMRPYLSLTPVIKFILCSTDTHWHSLEQIGERICWGRLVLSVCLSVWSLFPFGVLRARPSRIKGHPKFCILGTPLEPLGNINAILPLLAKSPHGGRLPNQDVMAFDPRCNPPLALMYPFL